MTKKKFSKSLIAFLIIALPLTSNALFEARLNYGAIVGKDALSEICKTTGVCGAGSVPGMVPLYGLGADVIFSPPLTDFGFGLRYEKLELSASSAGLEAKANMSRTALIVNYKLFDTIVSVGPIVTYGFSHSGGLAMKLNNLSVLDYSGSNATTYSIGLDVGIKPLIVIPLKIGAEAGYQSTVFKGMKDALGGASKDIDLSGPYAKIFLGIDI